MSGFWSGSWIKDEEKGDEVVSYELEPFNCWDEEV